MKILLINENPVVAKLVTLSAQKTSDELDVFESAEQVESASYDLAVIDDASYEDGMLDKLKESTRFRNALYIHARDNEVPDGFTMDLKKPFLPTDLIEIFTTADKATDDVLEEDSEEELIDLDDAPLDDLEELSDTEDLDASLDNLESMDVMEDDDEVEDLEELTDDFSIDGESVLDNEEAQKVKELLDEAESDEEFDLEDELDLGDLEDETLPDDIEDIEADEVIQELSSDDEGVSEEAEDLDEELESEIEDTLQTEELEEVVENQELDAEDVPVEDAIEEISLDDEDVSEKSAALEGLSEDEVVEDQELDLEGLDDDITLDASEEELFDETSLDTADDVQEGEDVLEADLNLEDDFEALEPEQEEDELEIHEEEIEDIGAQIDDAVAQLTPEELESEVDEDTLMQVVANEVDFDDLTSEDLKLALGEEIDDQDIEHEILEVEDEVTSEVENDNAAQNNQADDELDGTEALKALLNALNDKNVAAAMKGKKISINITIGDDA